MTDLRTGERPTGPAHRDFAHVILTRFNVRYEVDPTAPSIGVDPVWLGHRFALFERYCLPSVIAQTEQDYAWIIFFDAATPEPFAERARALAALRPNIYPIFCRELPLDVVKKTVRDVVTTRLGREPGWLLTSRLDNDDGLHADFVATVQAAQGLEVAEVLNCPLGIILSEQGAYRRNDPSNAFIALSEPFADFSTVFSILRHVYASESYPLRQVAERAMWLQVVHQSNISNRVRGRRTPLADAQPGFPSFGRDLHAESRLGILLENLSLYLWRSFRDTGVALVRNIARQFGVDLRRKPKPRRAITPSS